MCCNFAEKSNISNLKSPTKIPTFLGEVAEMLRSKALSGADASKSGIILKNKCLLAKVDVDTAEI